jgi:uncharacterized caspase-like protein
LIPAPDQQEVDKDNGVVKVKISGPELSLRAINAQDILKRIVKRNPFVVIFFLDCCRTYYLRNTDLKTRDDGDVHNQSHGLRPMLAGVGSLIAFACAPGTVANDGKKGETNGLFTKHLRTHIKNPNEDIRMVLAGVTEGVVKESDSKQVPFFTAALTQKNICLYNQAPGKY